MESTSPDPCPEHPAAAALAIQEVTIKSSTTLSEGPGKEFTAFTIAVEVGGDIPGWEVKRRFRCFLPSPSPCRPHL